MSRNPIARRKYHRWFTTPSKEWRRVPGHAALDELMYCTEKRDSSSRYQRSNGPSLLNECSEISVQFETGYMYKDSNCSTSQAALSSQSPKRRSSWDRQPSEPTGLGTSTKPCKFGG